MAGAREVARLHIAIGERMHGGCAFLRRNAGGQAFAIVDRYGEGGAERCIIMRHHGIELEAAGIFAGDRRADDAAAMADHEGHLLGRDLAGGSDQVAFILPVIVIDDDHHLAARNGGNGVLDAVEFGGRG